MNFTKPKIDRHFRPFVATAATVILGTAMYFSLGFSAVADQNISGRLVGQELHVSANAASPTVQRGEFTVTAPPVKPKLPTVTPDPGSAQAIALGLSNARGWNADEFSCLVALWDRESGWNVNAHNNSSGAHGIPQALPGSKMGTGWETDATVQITWGIGYIADRYGTPCGAWEHSESSGWY